MLVLIPSYQPDEKLLKIVEEIKEGAGYPILIVDDGSGEAYARLFNQAEELGCTVLRHRQNRGKGAALKTGFQYARVRCAGESVVCADSDGQHRLADIVRVAQAVDESRCEMVLGVRRLDGRIPFKSRIGNGVTAFVFGCLTGLRLRDTQTGLRGYPSGMLAWLVTVEGSRFEYEINLLLEAKEAGVSVRQVPIRTIYVDENRGTHFDPIRDSARVCLPLLKFGGASFTSAVLDFILLFVFRAFTDSLFWGVVLARTVSSIFNYFLNQTLVFSGRGTSSLRSAPKYFGLVTVIMFLNYGLLSLLTTFLHIPAVPAKIMTEILLFALGYTVQNKYVFLKGKTAFCGLLGGGRKPAD